MLEDETQTAYLNVGANIPRRESNRKAILALLRQSFGSAYADQDNAELGPADGVGLLDQDYAMAELLVGSAQWPESYWAEASRIMEMHRRQAEALGHRYQAYKNPPAEPPYEGQSSDIDLTNEVETFDAKVVTAGEGKVILLLADERSVIARQLKPHFGERVRPKNQDWATYCCVLRLSSALGLLIARNNRIYVSKSAAHAFARALPMYFA